MCIGETNKTDNGISEDEEYNNDDDEQDEFEDNQTNRQKNRSRMMGLRQGIERHGNFLFAQIFLIMVNEELTIVQWLK